MNRATEESLKSFEKEEEKRIRLKESKEECKRKQVEEDKVQIKHSKDEEVNPPSPPMICNGCKSEIKDGLPVNAFGGLWHPQCLCCLYCHKPIAEDEISEEGIQFCEHPFWKEKYCPCHEGDGTAKCCSCERLEPKGTNFVMLGDDRWPLRFSLSICKARDLRTELSMRNIHYKKTHRIPTEVPTDTKVVGHL
ncbi:hypothetical protein DY000_02011798 [Brassica cretica]|uniref:LIM zinc-binding domain-containing protein n=1 Tax=Brassica cretica TaxID=69181 RepID=A0ABQ7D9A6_BRACR|nr:hypothetical protein DY000_02011798 [Brassica cretica]